MINLQVLLLYTGRCMHCMQACCGHGKSDIVCQNFRESPSIVAAIQSVRLQVGEKRQPGHGQPLHCSKLCGRRPLARCPGRSNLPTPHRSPSRMNLAILPQKPGVLSGLYFMFHFMFPCSSREAEAYLGLLCRRSTRSGKTFHVVRKAESGGHGQNAACRLHPTDANDGATECRH